MNDIGNKLPQNEQREKEVKVETEENPLKLQTELNSLEVGNQQTFDEILQGYKDLIADIDVQLKNPGTTSEEKKKLVQQKKEYQIKIRELQVKYSEFASSGAKEEQRKKTQELIERIPEESSRKKFTELLLGIPEKFRQKYVESLEGFLSNKNEVSSRTGVRGLVFELSRINTLTNQGLEVVDFDQEMPPSVEYFGFEKNATDFTQEPTKKLKSQIEFDVPVARDGKSYVYEAKSYHRMQYGSLATQRNQLLKYQTAIERGAVEGATVEIRGRIDPNFLKWATGTNIAEAGSIPDVEIIYTFELPSGAEYRFVLKRSRKHNGLKFQNEGRSNTPESTLKLLKEKHPDQYAELMSKFGTEEEIANKLAEDRKIINGLQKSVLDRSIIGIITNVNVENPSAELQPYLEDPTTIESVSLFDEYETLRKETIYKKLLTKREIINVDNKRSSYSEFATRDYVEKSLREYQAYLQQNPEMARIKKAYILDGEESIQMVINKVMALVEKIKSFELARRQNEENPENHERERREEMGYVGLPEGVALDIEHITIDAIQEVNKKKGQTGRSYENIERFKDVEAVKQYLPDQDRRYLEIAIYDPVTGKTERNIDVNDTHIKRTSVELLKENIKRVEDKIKLIMNRFEELNQKTDKTPEEVKELKQLTARLKAKEMQGKKIESVKHSIELLKTEKVAHVKTEKDNTKKKAIAQEYDEKISREMEKLAGLYKEIIGGDREWDKIAKRISEKIDQNLIKFIYAVGSNGEIIVGEEIIRGDVSGRAAHSELAQGRNVYGAGELAFSKNKDGQWILTEINNGSGHYRPSVLTCSFVKKLLELKGINTSKVEIRDTLLRGTPPPDMTILEE